MELKITQKTFDAAPISALLREGEKAADTLVFVAPKQYGGLILGALQWVVVGNYADYDDFAQQPLQVAETDGNVTLTWVPDNTFTAHPGGMLLWLEGRDNDTTVIKITASQRIAIAPTARKANAAFYSGMYEVLQQITAAATAAQTNANTAVQAANTANDRATDAETAATSAGRDAKTANDLATDAEIAKNAAAQSASAAGESANQSAESAATAERNATQAATNAKAAKDAADKIAAEKIDDKLTQMGNIQTAVEQSASAAAKSAEDAQKALEQIDVRPLTKADIAELLAMI